MKHHLFTVPAGTVFEKQEVLKFRVGFRYWLSHPVHGKAKVEVREERGHFYVSKDVGWIEAVGRVS